jgi:hypothetical protein
MDFDGMRGTVMKFYQAWKAIDSVQPTVPDGGRMAGPPRLWAKDGMQEYLATIFLVNLSAIHCRAISCSNLT